ncbi:hypothetical protein F4810DRAFT_724308 [Camillea tinctor]|nr:hypothetical protein F4810DRAFT_724308 [Camillea tinctor]
MEESGNSPAIFDTHEPDSAQFARENDLSVDSQVEPLSFYLQFDQTLPRMTTDVRPNGLIGDASLHQLRLPGFPYLKEQQLDVSEKVLVHLHKAIRRDEQETSIIDLFHHDGRLSNSRLKIEPPLLKTDPDYDHCKLAAEVRNCKQAKIDPDTFPPEKLDTSNDEALDFPDSAYHFKNELENSIEIERIDIPKDTLYYLAKSLRDDWTEDQHKRLLQDETSHITTLQDLIVTSPLIPHEETDSYYIPDDDACQVPVASDPSTLLEDDLQAAEANIFKDDTIQIQSSTTQLPLSPLGDPPLLVPTISNDNSLKIEGPITPINSTPSPINIDIGNERIAESLDLDNIPEVSENGYSMREDNTEDNNDIIWATMEEGADSLMRDVEQEQLESTNALARVEVPTMDFSIPEPVWLKSLSLSETSHWACLLDTIEGFDIPQWPGDSNQERQQLYWSPFLQETKIYLTESIEDHGFANTIIGSLVTAEVLRSENYVYKQPGLRILDDIESDEELEPSPMLRNSSLDCLLKKRRLEIGSSNLEPPGSSRDPSPVDLIKVSTSTTPPPPLLPSELTRQASNLLVDCNSPSAASNLLSNYIDFHVPKRRKCEKSIFFSKPSRLEVDPKPLLSSRRTRTRPETSHSPIPDTNLQQTTMAAPVPCPELNISDTSVKFIKALTLSRGLFSRLEQLCPAATVIERDFDRWNIVSWDRNSVYRSPVTSALAAEADIIVSPATGIMVTTLLKVIQKPPPGHKGQAAIRERVRKVALRYERLIIIVSEDNQTDETMRNLTPFECSAYAEFCGFIAGLDMNAHVYYVGGGNDTLARWVLSFVTRHAREAAAVQDLIIQDETSWELFLRRAGMNAYAAQAILGTLKAPEDAPKEQTGCFGLPAFVRMTRVERIQVFRGLMGGERVLSRVNEVMDVIWNRNPTW